MEASISYLSQKASHRRSARARREQRERANARVLGSILQASALLASHRGCQPRRHLEELADLLAARQKPLGSTPASTSPPSPPAPSRPRPKAISMTRKPTALRNLFVDSSSAAEVTVGDGDFDSDLVLPLVVVDMPRQSVPQLVQLFERNASRQDRAAQPLRLDTADDEDEFSGPTSAVCYDCSPHADENDLSAFDERMRAADERIAGYFAAVQASYL